MLNRLDFIFDKLVFVMEMLSVFFDVLTGCVCTTEMNEELFASLHFSVSRNVGNYQSILQKIEDVSVFENLRSDISFLLFLPFCGFLLTCLRMA